MNVQFWYPDNAEGIYPLVVFSHGAFGIKASNASTYRELASHGYVVCSIDHPYHSFYTVADDGAVTLINSEYKTEVHFLASWFMIKSLVISLQAENPTRRSFFNFLIML
ncbi:hypothetical protein ACE3MQ_13125 [Paenibacillus lentus]|uniref:alpha/beta hydrolase n=1 Tax=Paenibacillus lentus TaxID=1338368 RepID=UPI003651ABFE